MLVKTIDLRSDTVTRPSAAMRRAMAEAVVGDDVYGEDPTVRRLEETAAEMTGQEAGLFVTSGTQGNLVSLLCHCRRGEGAILGSQSHILNYEGGGLAALGGIMPLSTRDSGGLPEVDSMIEWVRPANVHFAPARLLCLENTHNREGGNAVAPMAFRKVATAARDHGLAVHLDGARIFNAAAAWEMDVKTFTGVVDSVQLCLSKGLGAPVGSLVCGGKDFIEEARHWRKILGGGLRQAGVLAAAGILALKENVARLSDDHENAAVLAERLTESEFLSVEPCPRRTNMVYFGIRKEGLTAGDLSNRCRLKGVLFNPVNPKRARLVTHLDVTRCDVREAARIIMEEAANR